MIQRTITRILHRIPLLDRFLKCPPLPGYLHCPVTYKGLPRISCLRLEPARILRLSRNNGWRILPGWMLNQQLQICKLFHNAPQQYRLTVFERHPAEEDIDFGKVSDVRKPS